VATAHCEFFWFKAAPQVAHHASQQHDQRKRHVQNINTNKRGNRNASQPAVLEHPRANAVRG
jgi:hypothetical protein